MADIVADGVCDIPSKSLSCLVRTGCPTREGFFSVIANGIPIGQERAEVTGLVFGTLSTVVRDGKAVYAVTYRHVEMPCSFRADGH